MRFRWPLRRRFPSGSLVLPRDSSVPAAPEFLFHLRSLDASCEDQTPGQPVGQGIRLVAAGQPKYRRVRPEESAVSLAEIPALTIAADPSHTIEIAGHSRDEWLLRFCAYGDGNSESEALESLQTVSLVRRGATMFLDSPVPGTTKAGGSLLVHAPSDAPVTVHASFASVTVRNMAGPLRVATIHARATLLNTTGQVDATASVLDLPVPQVQPHLVPKPRSI